MNVIERSRIFTTAFKKNRMRALTQVAAKADIHINFRQKAMNISRQIIVVYSNRQLMN